MKDEFSFNTPKKRISFTLVLCIILVIAVLASMLVYNVTLDDKNGGEADKNIPQNTPMPTVNPDNLVSSENATTFTKVYSENCNSVIIISSFVTVEGESTPYSQSSGFIISEDGYALTNSHCIQDVDFIKVKLYSGEELDADIVAYDERTEVGVIKLKGGKGLTPVKMGDSDKIAIGEYAIAIGIPLGWEFSMSVGIISGAERLVSNNGYKYKILQIDTALNSGNSGGPLFNVKGEVIGINTMKPATSGFEATVEGIGFAIPINVAKRISQELIANGKVTRAAVNAMIGTATNGNKTAPYIAELVAGGAAEKAGLMVGDVITEFNGISVATVNDLTEQLDNSSPGDKVILTVIRGEKELKIEIILGTT
ncbi:MAG: trypsin-like peptidase domain-containing protein [Clostridia bacterium]|nr:trypsin-like peptidase domain-containing protein [Clostridia bacterium]